MQVLGAGKWLVTLHVDVDLGVFVVVPLLTRLLVRLTRTPVRPLITSGHAEPAL